MAMSSSSFSAQSFNTFWMEMRYFGTESLILSGRMYASHHLLPKIIKVRCEHFPDIVHVDLHLKIMLDVVIYICSRLMSARVLSYAP